MQDVLHRLKRFTVLAALLVAPLAQANPIPMVIDTSSLSGTSAQLAFDLIDGGPPGNTVTISAFSSDGTLGSFLLTGDASGSFPGTVTLGDTSFFNEYLQNIVLGTTLSFTFGTMENPANPSFTPDAFSLLFLDPTSGLPLFATSDPTGADALILYNIGALNPLEIYRSDAVTVTAGNSIPLPGTLPLLVAGLFALGSRHLRPVVALTRHSLGLCRSGWRFIRYE